MFTFESDEVSQLVFDSVERYEKYFKEDFPLQEYLDTDNGLVTVENASDFKELIDNSVKKNKPVKTPKDFYSRFY